MILWVLALLAGVTAGILQAGRVATARVESMLDANRDAQGKRLESLIETPLLIPEILAKTRAVRALISQPNAAAARELNESLEEMAQSAHADVIHLMDAGGNTLAASNWRAKDSFVGHNHGSSPYFQQAITGQTGRYTARDVTSHRLAVYLARPVTAGGEIRGVLAVKISLDSMQSHVDALWRQGQEMVLVSDANGVVILSPMSVLTFQAIQPIDAAARRAIEASTQYGDTLSDVSQRAGDSLNAQLRFVEFRDLSGLSFLQKSYALPELGLRVSLHVPASRYRSMVAEFTALFSLAALAVFLIVLGIVLRAIYAARLFATAIRDPLTGLSTRLYMNEWCDAAIRAHNRDPQAGFGLALFDLDLFRQVNDVHGHLAGDEVLRRVGEIMRNAIRGQDLGVRFGGEELAVFVQCADQAAAVAFAERLRRKVEQHAFRSGTDERIAVTLSGGVAYHAVGESADALFARADAKLREAKELGRNRISD